MRLYLSRKDAAITRCSISAIIAIVLSVTALDNQKDRSVFQRSVGKSGCSRSEMISLQRCSPVLLWVIVAPAPRPNKAHKHGATSTPKTGTFGTSCSATPQTRLERLTAGHSFPAPKLAGDSEMGTASVTISVSTQLYETMKKYYVKLIFYR